MSARSFLVCVFAAGLLATASQDLPRVAASRTTGERVKLNSSTKILTGKDSAAYLVDFSYAFDGPAIRIDGLGTVPAKGTYQFVSGMREIRFSDPATGAVLEKLPLRETTVTAAKPPLDEIPPETQFPHGFRAYTWELPASLPERANAVLKKYFLYSPHELNNLTYLATTYTPLPLTRELSDRGILAQVALLFSFPYDPAAGKYAFHIQCAAREGRALSDDLRPTANAEILQRANSFVDQLVAEMKAGK